MSEPKDHTEAIFEKWGPLLQRLADAPTPAPLKDVREGYWWRLANGTYYGQGFGPHPLVFENWFEVGKLEKLVRVRVTVEEIE